MKIAKVFSLSEKTVTLIILIETLAKVIKYLPVIDWFRIFEEGHNFFDFFEIADMIESFLCQGVPIYQEHATRTDLWAVCR